MQIEDNSTKILRTWSVIQLAGKVMKELDFFGICIYDPLVYNCGGGVAHSKLSLMPNSFY